MLLSSYIARLTVNIFLNLGKHIQETIILFYLGGNIEVAELNYQ